MNGYPMAAMERTMKIQEVILRALAKSISWWQAAEIIRITDRQGRRWHQRYQEFGYDGLSGRRRGKPSPKRMPRAAPLHGGRRLWLGLGCCASQVFHNSLSLRARDDLAQFV